MRPKPPVFQGVGLPRRQARGPGYSLSDAGALQEELKDLRKVSDAGRATHNARTGAHDYLVLAVAIALWWATSGPTTIIEPFPAV